LQGRPDGSGWEHCWHCPVGNGHALFGSQANVVTFWWALASGVVGG